MPPKSKTPADKAGASRDSFAGLSLSLATLEAYRAQFLSIAYAMPPERAAMLAALAFGGAAYD
jgi:hypothetical protein